MFARRAALDRAEGDKAAAVEALKPFAEVWDEIIKGKSPDSKHPQHSKVVIATAYFEEASAAIRQGGKT